MSAEADIRSGPPTRAEVCAVALAEVFRGDGELLANPIGTLPVIGGRLAKATVAPELVMTDGEALLVENILPVGMDAPHKVVAGYNPYRTMFDDFNIPKFYRIFFPGQADVPCIPLFWLVLKQLQFVAVSM